MQIRQKAHFKLSVFFSNLHLISANIEIARSNSTVGSSTILQHAMAEIYGNLNTLNLQSVDFENDFCSDSIFRINTKLQKSFGIFLLFKIKNHKKTKLAYFVASFDENYPI